MFSLLPAERCLSNNNEKSHNKKPNTAFVICLLLLYVLHKKSFPLTSFSVNVTKSAVSCGFGQIEDVVLGGCGQACSKRLLRF